MAGDWIKMRGALLQSPKLIAMARALHRSEAFRGWLTPGGAGAMNGQLISDDALRCVTCALLLRVWSASREFGKFEGDDLLLSHLSVPDLDLMAGCPGVGKAMVSVGWAEVKDGDQCGVVFRNFKQHNAPMSPAEKQSHYRARKNGDSDRPSKGPKSVTEALPTEGNKTVTREEKRREELNTKTFLTEGCSEAAKPPPAEPPLLTFPCVKGEEWGLTQAKLDEWTAAFPAVDVLGECRKALQWVRDNSTRMKTRSGMPAFLNRWLTKEQNRGGTAPHGVGPRGTPTPREDERQRRIEERNKRLGIGGDS